MKFRRRSGFSLLEMLFVLMLLTVFSYVASLVFTSVVTVFRENESAQTRGSRYESAMAQMRTDVWGASEIAVPEPGQAVLHYRDGRVITWRISAEGDLVRHAGGQAAAQWDRTGPGLIFGLDGGELLVTEKGEEAGLATRLVSEVVVGGER